MWIATLPELLVILGDVIDSIIREWSTFRLEYFGISFISRMSDSRHFTIVLQLILERGEAIGDLLALFRFLWVGLFGDRTMDVVDCSRLTSQHCQLLRSVGQMCESTSMTGHRSRAE